MKQKTNFTVGQLVKQNGTPDLIIIVTRISNDEFSGRVLVNEQNIYDCDVGDLVEGESPSGFHPITTLKTFGDQRNMPKFRVGDFIRHDDTSDGTYWTSMVTHTSKDSFGMVVITTTSNHIYPGGEFDYEDYEAWELAEIVVIPPVWKISVGDRVSSNLIHGDNMLTVTDVDDDDNTFTAVVVRNPMNPAQEGELYSGLIPSTFTPYIGK